jgi:hypothetical protein
VVVFLLSGDWQGQNIGESGGPGQEPLTTYTSNGLEYPVSQHVFVNGKVQATHPFAGREVTMNLPEKYARLQKFHGTGNIHRSKCIPMSSQWSAHINKQCEHRKMLVELSIPFFALFSSDSSREIDESNRSSKMPNEAPLEINKSGK